MTKQAHPWALGAAAAAGVALLNLPSGAVDKARLAAASLLIPLFGAAQATQSVANSGAYELLTRKTLVFEIERLKAQRNALAAEVVQGRAAAADNVRLRAALGWQARAAWKTRVADVIGRNPAAWWRGVTLGYGARDGARVNQPVLTAEGLVGRIRAVAPTTSEVALLGDPECGVSAVISETRDLGLLQPARAGSGAGALLTLKTLQRCPGIQPGQAVVTSGQGGVFPAGIPVGTVVDTRPGDGGLSTEARLRVSADLNRLEEVLVIVP